MARLKATADVAAESKPRENPLVPHRRLREMYLAMAGARLLAEWMTEHAGRGKSRGLGQAGEEACRASVLIGLERGDLVLDARAPLTASYLLGAGGSTLAKAWRAKTERTAALEDGRHGRRLAIGPESEGGLGLLAGAGLVLKSQGAGRVLVVILEGGDAGAATWKTVLTRTAKAEIPVLFVVLPGKGARAGEMSVRATRLGVPGIAVDADDAVALYRVAQESLVRSRMGGGPVLMECVRLSRARGTERDVDCLEAMRSVVVAKGAADEAWIERAEARLGTLLLSKLDAGASGST